MRYMMVPLLAVALITLGQALSPAYAQAPAPEATVTLEFNQERINTLLKAAYELPKREADPFINWVNQNIQVQIEARKRAEEAAKAKPEPEKPQ